jgi:very-short-patch-repair endonuclease
MTLPEVILWQELRGGKLNGLRFRRQHPVGPYILDFYLPSARLAIEVDGSVHSTSDQAKHDALRTAWLAKRGVRVLRIAASDVLSDEVLAGVLTYIAREGAPSTACGGPPPPLRGGGT